LHDQARADAGARAGGRAVAALDAIVRNGPEQDPDLLGARRTARRGGPAQAHEAPAGGATPPAGNRIEAA